MALVKCSECGAKVSDKAAACPQCGAPVDPASMQQINAAVKKYLTPDKISIVKAGDFAKKKS